MLRIAANEQADALQEETEEDLVGFRARSNVALKTCKKNRCVVHVHVCSFFQATSYDQLGAPCGGYPAENTTYDVNQSAMDWR